MNFDDTIRLHALKLKQLNTEGHSFGSALVDQLIDKGEHPMTRNVCASVSPQMFDDLTSLCGLLDISKRRFVELAIFDAIKRTGFIMDEIKPLENEAS